MRAGLSAEKGIGATDRSHVLSRIISPNGVPARAGLRDEAIADMEVGDGVGQRQEGRARRSLRSYSRVLRSSR